MPFPHNDERLQLLQANIDRVTQELYQKLIERILAGENPRDVIAGLLEQFNEEIQPVIAAAFSVALEKSISVGDLKEYKIGGLDLSRRLYLRSREVSRDALGVIRGHLKGYLSARKLALKLYEGYGFNEKEALDVKAKLPKYLQKPLADVQAAALRTNPLRAAYVQLLDKKFKGASDEQLQKLTRVAWYERNRYFASRIARTEVARAINIEEAKGYMGAEDIEYAEVVLSAAHPVVDICDFHARVDKYGVGPGVYPKALAPVPPFHPHCFCRLIPRWDLTGQLWRERKKADKSFFRGMTAENQRKVAGSREKADEILGGKKVVKVVDAAKPKTYRTRFAGEYQ